jgi:hypothetical protein
VNFREIENFLHAPVNVPALSPFGLLLLAAALALLTLMRHFR